MGLGCMKDTYKQNHYRLDIASVGIGLVVRSSVVFDVVGLSEVSYA